MWLWYFVFRLKTVPDNLTFDSYLSVWLTSPDGETMIEQLIQNLIWYLPELALLAFVAILIRTFYRLT